MTESKKGRPSIQLVPEILRQLREERGWTQLDVTKRVKEGSTSTEATLKNGYQRLENSGRTSPKVAAELAKLFGVSVALLEGKEYPEPADYEAQVLAILKKRLAEGNSHALKQELDVVSDNESPELTLQRLARNVCFRIESAQLARNPDELKNLADLIGLSHEEILKPANADGYWLIRVSDYGADGLQTEIVRGISTVVYRIQELVGDRLDRHASDGEIRLRRDGYWYRIEITQPLLPYPMHIDFVRCRPEADGLRWLKPTSEEKFWLDMPLLDWANNAANFVTSFDGVRHPADVTRLRLRVISGNRELIAISAEIPDAVLQDAQAHELTQNWLAGKLGEFLIPRLKEHPRLCWDVDNWGDAINLYPSPGQDIPDGLRYEIHLVEELETGQYVHAPWPLKDKSRLKSRIEEWLS